MTNYTNEWIAKKFSELRELYGGVCNHPNCKTTKNLEFAHIEPTDLSGRGRGRKERYYDIVKHPSHYVLLCKYHHLEYDRVAIFDYTVKILQN